MKYQRSYSLIYALLIAISILAPERYGVTFKYAFFPLAFMLVLGISGRKLTLNCVRIKSYAIYCLCWIVLMIISTISSDVVGWTPNARSFCLLVLFFVMLYEMVPDEHYMNILKHVYICLTLFCSLWIIGQSFNEIDRYSFMFISGKKDVNYLAAFMLPGFYMALRFLFFGKRKWRYLYFFCIIGCAYSVLLVQSRAAFITLLLTACFSFVDYVSKTKISMQKIIIFTLSMIAIVVAVILIWNNESFSRLTVAESYEDNVRLTIWEYAIKAFLDSPIIGSGLGSSNYFAQARMDYDTHCNYIDILGDSGIIGLALFICLSCQILMVKKGNRLHMISYYVACMLPLAFVNGLQTIAFWLPMLLLAHEHVLINRKADCCNQNECLEPKCKG